MHHILGSFRGIAILAFLRSVQEMRSQGRKLELS